MEAILQNTINMYKEFFGTGIYIAMFVFAIIYIMTVLKDKNNKRMILGQILVFLIIYFFPVTAYIIMKYCIGNTVYWRMFWLLPISVIIAYVMTDMVFHVEFKWKRLSISIFIIVLIGVFGEWIYSSDNFIKNPNRYNLNQDVLVVCDAIEEDADKNMIDQKSVIVPNALATGIRQYDASIRMPYGRDAIRKQKVSKLAKHIYDIMNDDDFDACALAYYATQGNYKYLVYPINEQVDNLKNAGYQLVEDVGNYNLFRLQDNAVSDSDWLITQYGSETNQMIFYTLQDPQGHLIVVDGGWVDNAKKVKKVIKSMGDHVDAWILTHPHEDHIGAFCEIYDDPGDMKIDHVYTVEMADPNLCKENASWDSVDMYERFRNLNISQLSYVHTGDTFDIDDLKVQVLSAYEPKVDELSNDLLNDGSMMFQVHNDDQTMLFCADVGKNMSKYLLEKYSDSLKSDYIQMGHHGNGGLREDFYRTVAPKVAFFDAPDWLFNDTTGKYTTPQNREIMESIGSSIVSFSTAPNSVILK